MSASSPASATAEAPVDFAFDVRTVSAPSDAGNDAAGSGHSFRIGMITMRPTAKLLVWSAEAITAFERYLHTLPGHIRDADLDALVFTAAGSVFGAGADLSEFQRVATPAEATESAARAFRAFAGLLALPVPTFSLLNGAALGGGLEVALHTDFRLAAAGVTGIGLPELSLGLVPGWGGLTWLTALVGPDVAARIAVVDSLAGRSLSAARARDLGVIDAVVPADRLTDASLDFAAGVLAGSVAVPRRPAEGAGLWKADDVRARVRRRIPTDLPAVDAAVELIGRATSPLPGCTAAAGVPTASAGLATARERIATYARSEAPTEPLAEATVEAFGRLLLTDEARASIYAFFTLQRVRRAARPGGAQLDIRQVGVVGGGLMATQLAVVFATRLRVPVVVVEVDQDRADLASSRIDMLLEQARDRGTLDEASHARVRALVTTAADRERLVGSDVVIEAVFEDLAVKQQVWREVEALVSPQTLLLTNTSSLLVGDQAGVLEHPERLIGFHFFNPVAVLPLVELILPKGATAHDEAAAHRVADTALSLAARLGKTAVHVADHPGFLVNRLLSRLIGDALHLIDSGWDVATVDGALVGDGLPMTPLTLLDYIGHGVQLHIFETLHAAWPARFPVSASLQQMVEVGGRSRLRYLTAAGELTPEAAEAIATARARSAQSAETPRAARHGDAAEARGLLLDGLAQEVNLVLADGTAESPQAVDAALMLGANYPRHTGGLIPLLDRSGASRRVTGGDLLPRGTANVPEQR
ncbi:3-hydroxyacyl-CoA dehydrogenase NAD-binding domain-containing protein [Pseudoclavibacter sp. 13-3]|uniref:3-hydroxyacyl-CoA dehydrogenase NAD-binding domain-containing protein n=1 Tax=Pseudoclavibacter sp. 13-3 TaxID=2901228 RepID=UPI001E55C735|nr:3-hydroxyacyl-CoA dehydrogenase NAD-binding domain-containing protein [Pseudoclavibacter sp. 13-3]MCD7100674.1 3-hydroxyacyl-CoA dehydrogenase NAD-binding domain-containing protein [Pseudoclavibacter sp. 13-3]